MRRILTTILFASLSLSFIGCGEKGPAVTPVSVTITHKGSPLAGATVAVVSSDGKGNTAGGMTNSSGVASLETPPSWKGVIPGEYAVAVKKWESYSVPAPSEDDPKATATQQRNLLPAKYGEHSSSGFKLTVGNKAVQESFDVPE